MPVDRQASIHPSPSSPSSQSFFSSSLLPACSPASCSVKSLSMPVERGREKPRWLQFKDWNHWKVRNDGYFLLLAFLAALYLPLVTGWLTLNQCHFQTWRQRVISYYYWHLTTTKALQYSIVVLGLTSANHYNSIQWKAKMVWYLWYTEKILSRRLRASPCLRCDLLKLRIKPHINFWRMRFTWNHNSD